MVSSETPGNLHDAAAVSSIVGRIASWDDGTYEIEILLVIEITIARETINGIADLLDGMLDVNAFQFNEQASILLWIDGMMAEEIVALVVSDVGVEVAIYFVFVNDSDVVADN